MTPRPTLVQLLPADRLDHRLSTARCAAPSLPSDLAHVTALIIRASPVRARAAATWRWYCAHGKAVRAAKGN